MGFSLEEIGLALGHKPKGIPTRYVHDADGRRSAERLLPILLAWEAEVKQLIEMHA